METVEEYIKRKYFPKFKEVKARYKKSNKMYHIYDVDVGMHSYNIALRKTETKNLKGNNGNS